MTNSAKTVAVLGAGVMGSGIAQVAAQAGYHVVLFDAAASALEKGIGSIRATLEKGVAKGKVTAEDMGQTLERIRICDDLRRSVAEADLVIEAISENLEAKKALFAAVDAAAPKTAILASNTSSLSIAAIAAATQRSSSVVGMHFFNPPHLMTLLELVVAPKTSSETLNRAKAYGSAMSREMIIVKDSPGFATSRLGVALGLEAIRMLEEGVASAADIDRAMELGYRHPMGPLRLTDLVGLDTRLAIADYLWKETGKVQFRAPDLLRRMVSEGKVGKKSGLGFYDWNEIENERKEKAKS